MTAMLKYFLLLLVSFFVLTICHGCNFINEHFIKQPSTQQTPEDQTQQENQGDPQKNSGPIPVNPSHS